MLNLVKVLTGGTFLMNSGFSSQAALLICHEGLL
jgi:hypothetical protein